MAMQRTLRDPVRRAIAQLAAEGLVRFVRRWALSSGASRPGSVLPGSGSCVLMNSASALTNPGRGWRLVWLRPYPGAGAS